MASRRVSARPIASGSTAAGLLTPRDELEMAQIMEDEIQRRPSSSASRQAWSDNDGFDMGSEEKGNYGQEFDDQDEEDKVHAPTAMESELYVGDRIADETIGVAIATKENLMSQRGTLKKITNGVTNMANRFPVINSLVQRINLRKRRDSLVLGGVIAVCIIFLLWYTFH